MGVVAFIGDVSGHRRCLNAALARVGADVASLSLPPNLAVVQVGDLIGGPDGNALVAEVDRWMDRYPDRWIQLVGNWEARHLGGPAFEKRNRELDPLDATGLQTLKRWAATGRARIAVAVRSASGTPVLATHAGLPFEFWSQKLDGTTDVADAAQRLNALLRDDRSAVFRAGKMYSPSRSGQPVGPVWARAGDEVWPSWIGVPMPFGQIHGHTSPYFWGQNRWSAEVAEDLKKRARLLPRQRHVWFDQGDHRIIGIDPGLGIQPRGDELWASKVNGEVLGSNDVRRAE